MVGPVELCRAIAATGPAVAFATPAYPPFFAELEAAGFRVFTAGRDSDGKIDVEALDDVQHEHASLLRAIAAEVAFTEGDTWLDAVIAQLHYNRTRLAADLADPHLLGVPKLRKDDLL